MDAKAEAKAKADAERHSEQFRKRHGISRREYALAAEMADDCTAELHRKFWEVYDREHPVQPADSAGPAERPAPRHRKR